MNLYEITVDGMGGDKIPMETYKGKVLLIVNTATGCGFTPQYKGLQELYDKYSEKGLEILDFPCNQFGNQAPGNEQEIQSFCTLNYKTTFPRFAKIEVNGKNEAPIYSFLKKSQGGILGSKIKWNFTKFLVDRQGNVVNRYGSAQKPEALEKDILELL